MGKWDVRHRHRWPQHGNALLIHRGNLSDVSNCSRLPKIPNCASAVVPCLGSLLADMLAGVPVNTFPSFLPSFRPTFHFPCSCAVPVHVEWVAKNVHWKVANPWERLGALDGQTVWNDAFINNLSLISSRSSAWGTTIDGGVFGQHLLRGSRGSHDWSGLISPWSIICHSEFVYASA